MVFFFQARPIGCRNDSNGRKRDSLAHLSLDDGDLMSDAMIESAERFILSSESADPNAITRAPYCISSDDMEQSLSASCVENAVKLEPEVPDTEVLQMYCSGTLFLLFQTPFLSKCFYGTPYTAVCEGSTIGPALIFVRFENFRTMLKSNLRPDATVTVVLIRAKNVSRGWNSGGSEELSCSKFTLL